MAQLPSTGTPAAGAGGQSRAMVANRYVVEPGPPAWPGTWLGHDTELPRDVAIVEIPAPPGLGPAETGAWRLKARAAALPATRFQHPSAVTTFDLGELDDNLVVVTEAPGGRSLSQVLAADGPLAPVRVAELGAQLASSLAAAHANGLVHGAVSPACIVVPDAGPARLWHWGVAPALEELDGASGSGSLSGSAAYSPPERPGPASPDGDVWSLGAVLRHAAPSGTGSPDVRLASVLGRLTAADPTSRPSADDAARQLTELAAELADDLVDELAEAAALAGPRETGRDGRGRWWRRKAHPEAPVATPEPGQAVVPDAPAAAESTPAPDSAAAADDAPGPADDAPAPEAPGPEAPGPEAPGPEGFAFSWGPFEPAEPEELDGDAPAEPATVTIAEPAPAEPATVTLAEAATAEPATAEPAPAEPATVTLAEPATVTPAEAATAEAATAEAATAGAAEEAPTYRTSFSWPPPRRIRIGVSFLAFLMMGVMLVLLLTNGRIGRPAAVQPRGEAGPAPTIPGDWVAYRDPQVGFGISHPPTWTVRQDGPITTISDPSSGAFLKVDYTNLSGTNLSGTNLSGTNLSGGGLEQAWLDLERVFAAASRNYSRLQLMGTTFQSYPAAIWEFTFSDGDTLFHAADLGMSVDPLRFALYFQAPAGDWGHFLPTFHSFVNSFRASR